MVGLALTLVSPRVARGEQTNISSSPAVPGSKLGTDSSERLKALKKEVDVLATNSVASQLMADANIPRMLDLVRQEPDSVTASEVLLWIMQRPEIATKPYELGVLELLRENQVTNPRIGWICRGIGWYYNHKDDWRKPATMDLLHAVAEKNPDRAARGQATLALARLTKNKASYLECFQNSIPAMRDTQSEERRAEYLERWSNEDANAVSREAGRLFDVVIEQYGDCREFPKRPDLTLAKGAERDLYELRHLAVGQAAPEIVAEDLDGRGVRLSDYRGKVVVICFWATWCPSCMDLIPLERALVSRMAGKKFAIVGINGDVDRVKASTAADKQGITWQSFWDRGPDGPISSSWNVLGWPTVYILDAKGVIRFKAMDDGANMDNAVSQLMNGQPGRN